MFSRIRILFVFICFLFFVTAGFSRSSSTLSPSFYDYPVAEFSFNGSIPNEVYYHETVRIPVRMDYFNLKGSQSWYFPAHSTLTPTGGSCPPFVPSNAVYGSSICFFNVIVDGDNLGQVVTGRVGYHTSSNGFGRELRQHTWDRWYYTSEFKVVTVPHPLSMVQIPRQKSVAGVSFQLPISPYILYALENKMGGYSPEVIITPETLDGLTVDKTNSLLKGTPTRTGEYHFKVSAKNSRVKTAPVDIVVNVEANPKDKPSFKKNVPQISLVPNQDVQINLMNLIEPSGSWMGTNQVHFRITWHNEPGKSFYIDETSGYLLKGRVSKDFLGQSAELTVIASSNTGGDSSPYLFKMDVSPDPALKPVINTHLEWTVQANHIFYEDLTNKILDKTNDPELSLLIDQTSPVAGWLTVSSDNLRAITGEVPEDLRGKTVSVILRASSKIGGLSDPVTVIFHVI